MILPLSSVSSSASSSIFFSMSSASFCVPGDRGAAGWGRGGVQRARAEVDGAGGGHQGGAAIGEREVPQRDRADDEGGIREGIVGQRRGLGADQRSGGQPGAVRV